jgi:hypothetical protein
MPWVSTASTLDLAVVDALHHLGLLAHDLGDLGAVLVPAEPAGSRTCVSAIPDPVRPRR